MRRPRPIAYNPAQVLKLITDDRKGAKLVCPACNGRISRHPGRVPAPPPNAQHHVTLHCQSCGRVAHYLGGPLSTAGAA